MKNKIALLGLVLAALLAAALPAAAAPDTAAALEYLKTQQNADGGFGNGFTPDSSLSATADTLLAIVAAGGELSDFDKGGNTPVTYLAGSAPSAATAGELSKLILAAVAAGQNPRQFGGVDSVAKLEATIGADGKIGTANDTFVSHLLAILALKSVQRPIPPAAVDLLLAAQQANGAWAWDGAAATPPDTNTTAFAVQALVAAGEPATGPAVTGALAYYKSIQNEDGGWPYQNPSDFGTATDANSTAVSMQAILAAGQDPLGAGWASATGQTPGAALDALQNPSGAFAWKGDTPGDNLLATVQALPALAGKAFPFASLAAGDAQAPATIPTTGGAALGWALPLLLGGAGLAAGGALLRRR